MRLKEDNIVKVPMTVRVSRIIHSECLAFQGEMCNFASALQQMSE